jgi:hypothetical protein
VAGGRPGRREPRYPVTWHGYRGHLDRTVLLAHGALRLREATVPRLDAFLTAVRAASGTAAAKTCRSLVSGILGLAVRHGALPSNPARGGSAASRAGAGSHPAP